MMIYLLTTLVMKTIMSLLLIMITKIKRMTMNKKEIERLTKELNTLKLAHETTLEDHRELLKTHDKLRFEKLNLEQEHEFLKAINDDLRKKSSSYIAKRLLLSTYMPQVKSSNKKDSSSSSNNDHVKSNIVAS